MKIFIICAVGCLISTVMSAPLPQGSLDHLIIPYEDSPVDYGTFESDHNDFKDEPLVITSYNVGSFRQGDYLQVPLGASYTVAGPDQSNRLKKGIVKTETFPFVRRGIVL